MALIEWSDRLALGVEPMDATLAFFLRCIKAGIDPMQALAARQQGASSPQR